MNSNFVQWVNVMKWGVGPELPFHEGGKVGRSDATPIKFFSSDNKNVSITRKKLDHSFLLSRPHEIVILVLPLISLHWLIKGFRLRARKLGRIFSFFKLYHFCWCDESNFVLIYSIYVRAISSAQSHIQNQNRKSCKMYENLRQIHGLGIQQKVLPKIS